MAEKRTIELEIQDNSKSLKAQYREALVELQKISEQYGNTSKEAAVAAQKAAELKDQIAFSKDLVEGFNPDAKFKAVEGAINGVLNGFQAFEGGLALVGVESDDLQKTMVRLQGVMALTQGINGVMEAGDAFDVLKTKIKDTAIGQGLLTVATTVYNTVVGTTTGGMKALRIAMLSTGIGALVVGIGLLIANFDKVISLFKPIIDGFKAIGDFIGITDFAAQEKSKNDAKRTEEELKRIEAVRKTREKNFNNEQSAYDREIKLQQALGKSTLELQKAKINASIKYQETKKKELEQELLGLKILFENSKFFGDLVNEGFANYENEINNLTNSIADQKTELQILDIESKKAATTTTTTTTSGGGGMTTTQKEKLNIERKLVDERLRIMEDGFDKEYALLQEKLKRDKEDAKKQLDDGVLVKKDYDKLLLQLDESFEADRKKLYDKSFNDRLQQRDFTINTLIEEKKSEAEIEMAAWMEKRQKQKEQDAEELARQKQLNQDKLKLAKDGLQLVSSVMDLFGKQDERRARLAFQVDKAAKISSATMAGYEAVLEAYKTGQKSPLTAVFPAYPYVQAGLAGAFAAVNIAKIGQSKFSASGGGGGSTSPAGGGATPMTANFSTIGSSGINQLAQLQQKPTQAYVVSGEVTSAQALDRNRVQNATL
tara:strand:+ start:1778 stop:3754 length:1977 start_codon:yes stop_codon:yes gene_type:complete